LNPSEWLGKHSLKYEDYKISKQDLDKYFSLREIQGYSLKGDVDLQHYNAQSEEDLKKIYDKVFNKSQI
jgi:hypothetical protein